MLRSVYDTIATRIRERTINRALPTVHAPAAPLPLPWPAGCMRPSDEIYHCGLWSNMAPGTWRPRQTDARLWETAAGFAQGERNWREQQRRGAAQMQQRSRQWETAAGSAQGGRDWQSRRQKQKEERQREKEQWQREEERQESQQRIVQFQSFLAAAAAAANREHRMRQELPVQARVESMEAGPGSAYGEASGAGSADGEASGSEDVMFACPSEGTFDPSEDPWEAAMAEDTGAGLNHFLTDQELGRGMGQGSSTDWLLRAHPIGLWPR